MTTTPNPNSSNTSIPTQKWWDSLAEVGNWGNGWPPALRHSTHTTIITSPQFAAIAPTLLAQAQYALVDHQGTPITDPTTPLSNVKIKWFLPVSQAQQEFLQTHLKINLVTDLLATTQLLPGWSLAPDDESINVFVPSAQIQGTAQDLHNTLAAANIPFLPLVPAWTANPPTATALEQHLLAIKNWIDQVPDAMSHDVQHHVVSSPTWSKFWQDLNQHMAINVTAHNGQAMDEEDMVGDAFFVLEAPNWCQDAQDTLVTMLSMITDANGLGPVHKMNLQPPSSGSGSTIAIEFFEDEMSIGDVLQTLNALGVHNSPNLQLTSGAVGAFAGAPAAATASATPSSPFASTPYGQALEALHKGNLPKMNSLINQHSLDPFQPNEDDDEPAQTSLMSEAIACNDKDAFLMLLPMASSDQKAKILSEVVGDKLETFRSFEHFIKPALMQLGQGLPIEAAVPVLAWQMRLPLPRVNPNHRQWIVQHLQNSMSSMDLGKAHVWAALQEPKGMVVQPFAATIRLHLQAHPQTLLERVSNATFIEAAVRDQKLDVLRDAIMATGVAPSQWAYQGKSLLELARLWASKGHMQMEDGGGQHEHDAIIFAMFAGMSGGMGTNAKTKLNQLKMFAQSMEMLEKRFAPKAAPAAPKP